MLKQKLQLLDTKTFLMYYLTIEMPLEALKVTLIFDLTQITCAIAASLIFFQVLSCRDKSLTNSQRISHEVGHHPLSVVVSCETDAIHSLIHESKNSLY